MPVTQMNLRIDAQVKERGDAALAQVGYSPSRAVRTLWEFAAADAHNPHAIKSFFQQADSGRDADSQARIAHKLEVLNRALGLQKQLEAVMGKVRDIEVNDISDEDLRGDALLSRWEERGLV